MNDGKCDHGVPSDQPCLLCPSTNINASRGLGGAVEAASRIKSLAPSLFDDDVERLVELLHDLGIWTDSGSITRLLTAAYPLDRHKRFSRTYIRHLAKASGGRVISGQKGYKATKCSNVDEVQGAAAVLMKAALGCIARRKDILYYFHNGKQSGKKA